MENHREGVVVVDASVTSHGEGSDCESNCANDGVSENLGVDLLEDLDCYLEDINGRLMISRMVSDSVIKGMVNAVEQEAAEKFAAKEVEVARLKELLNQIESNGRRNTDYGPSCSFLDADDAPHSKTKESLESLRIVAKEKFERMKREIDSLRGCSSTSTGRINSGAELVGLGGILQERTSESQVGVDETLANLNTIVDTICLQVNDTLHLAKKSYCEWKQEQSFRGQIEALVMQSCIGSFQDEFKEKENQWEQKCLLSSNQIVNWLEKIDEISSLRQKLDAILTSLSGPETGDPHFHGSHDIDHFHRKVLNNHISSSTSLWEVNTKPTSEVAVPENWDFAQLKHMTKDELVTYFNTVITKMKRNHESKVQEMTEEYFSLKREYLKEKGSSVPLKKDKEVDILKKKIPEVLSKLDDILVENEKLPTFINNTESINSLKDRVNELLSENHQLRESLADKQKELKVLSSKVSDATEKMLQHSVNEVKMLNVIEDLKYSVEYAHLEAFITEEVYKCALQEVTTQTKHDTEDTLLESIAMQEICDIVYREAVQNAEASTNSTVEDSDIEYLVMQGLLGVLYREAIEDADSQLKNLSAEFSCQNEIRAALEMKALEREKQLTLEDEEKVRLKEEVYWLTTSMEDQKKKIEQLSVAFTKEREQLELVTQELNDIRDQANRQQIFISESSKEYDLVKGKLNEALDQIEVNRVEMNQLNEKIGQTMKKLKEVSEERNMLVMVVQEKHNYLLSIQVKEKEQIKQLEAVTDLVHGLSKALADIEHRVPEDIKKISLRLECSNSQLRSLIQRANTLRKRGLQYKRRLEKRCSDLQMAEAEVDLLGDEVDALLSLLEKTYIALDHYSPVLQHYPGIIEILKLIRRELSGESAKPV